MNESVSAFLPLILFGLYVGNANALSLSSIVMTNMMIQNISSSMNKLNQQYEFSLRLYEAIIRLNKFYLIPDKQQGLVNQKTSADFEYALTIKGNFSWGIFSTPSLKDKEKSQSKQRSLSQIIDLKDINLQVRKGEFVVIIGEVASGKSTLLNAIIGEMVYLPQD